MNDPFSFKSKTIAENCRSILQNRHAHPGFSSNTSEPYPPAAPRWNDPFCAMPRFQVPAQRCYPGASLAPMQPILNKQTSHVQYLSVPSDNCIQMITNAIVARVRPRVSFEDIQLLCCCLPALIRQIMCKSPWLTPNDVVQWMSADIIKESIAATEEEHRNARVQSERGPIDDPVSIKPSASRSSHRRRGSQDSILSRQSSRSDQLQSPLSSSSFSPERRRHDELDDAEPSSVRSHRSRDSATPSSRAKSQRARQFDDIDQEDEQGLLTHSNASLRSFKSRDDLKPKRSSSSIAKRTSRTRLAFPGKKDPGAAREVEKCLAFYQKAREYFDDDVAAMLLKCCLCYGQCGAK